MGFITAPFEARSTLANPDTFLQRFFGVRETLSGADVNQETALTCIPVYAAILILSESVGQLPFGVFRRTDEGSQPERNHPLWSVLHDEANPEMSAIDWRSTSQGHICTWGNHYSQVVRDAGGGVRELWPLLPNRMRVERSNDNRQLRYIYRTQEGPERVFSRDKILHIPGWGYDGLIGYSPIAIAREGIGLGLAMESHGAAFFGNSAAPSGTREHPGSLTKTAFEHLKESFNEKNSGVANAHKPLILEEGMTWKQIGIPPEDSQFLETRQFQVREIARLYRLPPHMLADLADATFSNIEQQGRHFVVHSLLPWLIRWEQGIKRQLFTAQEKSEGLFLKMNVNAFQRGDTEARFKSYAIGRTNGWLTVNDILKLEDMNTIGGEGDTRIQPMNMQALGTPEPQAASN